MQTTTTNKARDAMAWIEARITEGMTIRMHTMTRVTAVTPTSYAKWAAAGKPFFFERHGVLYGRERGKPCVLNIGDRMLVGIDAVR